MKAISLRKVPFLNGNIQLLILNTTITERLDNYFIQFMDMFVLVSIFVYEGYIFRLHKLNDRIANGIRTIEVGFTRH